MAVSLPGEPCSAGSEPSGPEARSRPAGRVLMLAASYHPHLGGVEKHLRCVTRELRAMGVEVRIATPAREQPEGEDLVDSVSVTRLSVHKRAARHALEPLVDWADIIHSHDAYPFLKFYLPFSLRSGARPAFVTFHGYERYPIPLEARVLRRLVRWRTRGSLCAGAFIPKWYRFTCGHITHGGVDAPQVRPPLGEGAVFAGRLEPDTGLPCYLEALRLLKQEHSIAVPLQVLGDGSLRPQAEAFCSEHGLQVEFFGMVSDVMPFLREARYAFCSGLLSMLEAMACGALVLAVYDNPLKEDYLRLSPTADFASVAGDPATLANQLLCLSDPVAAEEVAGRAFEFARTQTWHAVAELYLDLWSSLTAKEAP